jgi:hypothetical protein
MGPPHRSITTFAKLELGHRAPPASTIHGRGCRRNAQQLGGVEKMIQFGRRMREGCRWFPGADPRYRLHPLPPGVGRGGATASGFQPAMVRAQSRACTLSVMPGNSRRSSTAAESSPPRSKALRIAAASASLTTNIARAWGTHTAAGKQRSADTTPRRRDRAGRQGKEREGRVQETAEVAKGKGRDRRGSPLSPHEPPWLTKPVTPRAPRKGIRLNGASF